MLRCMSHLASDLSDGLDFIGSAHCFVGRRVLGSAIFLGPGITDLPVHQSTSDSAVRIVIPVVAHY